MNVQTLQLMRTTQF